jgi:hypothetical protein
VKGILGCHGDLERLGIGVADIFGGKDNHATGNEKGIFPGLKHSHHPVEGGIRITAAKTFDKGRDDVVVFIAGLIVLKRLALQGFL